MLEFVRFSQPTEKQRKTIYNSRDVMAGVVIMLVVLV